MAIHPFNYFLYSTSGYPFFNCLINKPKCSIPDKVIPLALSNQITAVQLSDKQISESLRKGDEKVFEQLFRHYYPRICSYANGIIKDMDEAEEIVQ